jgi:hypothetical protein
VTVPSAVPLRREEVAVAWAHHINLGDYTTAALMWLERCGMGGCTRC